jgi:hypothetical protein
MFLLLGVLALGACESNRYCTQEFATITIEVNGAVLDDFYTIRLRTGDTIRSATPIADKYYEVLDDLWTNKIKKEGEYFLFEGKAGDSVLVREQFRIGHDECHIRLLEGRTRVDL